MSMFYQKTWTGQADGAGVGPDFVQVAGTGSGFKVSGGMIAPLDTGSTLARLKIPVSTPGEAYAEWTVGAAPSAAEVYVGLATEITSTTDLAHDAIYVRVNAGLIRLYRKTAASSSLTAIGVSGGNIAYVPVAGDVIRITIHNGALSYSVNGSVKYTFTYTAVPLTNYIYPAFRMRQGTPQTLLAKFKAADYGVEVDPGNGGIPLMSGIALPTKTKYLGRWTGSAVDGVALQFLQKYVPPVPMSAPANVGPDSAMQNPPAIPSSFTPLRTVNVTDNATLAAAQSDAQPGDLIQLAAGTYYDQKLLLVGKKGTAANPIVIRGPREAVIHLGVQSDSTDYGSGYGGQLDQCEYVWVMGLTITKAPKGLILDESNHCWIKGVLVRDVEQEGVHFRNNSSYNLAEDCTSGETGKKSAGFGEAFYAGSAHSNWTAPTSRTGGAPDKSDYNTFRRCRTYQHTGEGVDIKEGTTGNIVEYCYFDGSALNDDNSADTWVDVKGNDSIIQYNFGDTTFNGAYSVYNPLSGTSGLRTVFRGNTGNCYDRNGLPTADPAINDKVPNSGTIVYSDNSFQYSPSLSNDPITPVPTS